MSDDQGPPPEASGEPRPDTGDEQPEPPGAADTIDGEAVDTEAYTTSVRTLDPRVRWLWYGRALFVSLVVGVAIAGITFAASTQLESALVDPLLTGPAAFVLAAVFGLVHATLLYRSWEYHVREDSLYLDRGVFTKVQTVVPYVRVQHIDTSRGPIERAIGLSSLVVYTAGSRGADVTVPGLTPEEASDLQSRLKALAIVSEGEDAV